MNVPRDNSFSKDDEDENDGYASNEYFSDENQRDDEEKEDHFENSRATSVISPTKAEPAPLHHLHCRQRKMQHLPKERQTPQIKQPTKKRERI